MKDKPKFKLLRSYRGPTKKAFNEMGLGKLVDGKIKVVAGFQFRWWDPVQCIVPLFVNARVTRIHK